jgi:threonine aldolase
MDGARLFNAKTVLGCSKVSEITQYADSVCFCLSKGLCCPIGSILAGTKEFIERARAFRDCLGGTFDNPAMLAAAGIVALNEMIGPLKDDHRIAKLIG